MHVGRSCAIFAATLLLLASHAGADLQRISSRIVNGSFTSDYPATGLLLGSSNPGSASLLCSGTMIGCRTFLTAGHCVEDSLDPNDYGVFLQHAGFQTVANVELHPDYAFPPADVAVITFTQDVSAIRPIPLDTTGGHASGTTGTIVGFGRSGGSAGDYGLKRVGDVEIATCTGVSNTTSICWNFENPVGPPGDDSNTCNGDSGGPLFIDPGGGTVVAGITSGGNAGDCLAPDASFDARVSFYAGWIQGEGGADLSNTSCGSLPQVGDPDTTVAGFVGSVSAASPEGRHTVDVSSGTLELRVTMNSVDDGSDFDLFVKFGAPPTSSDFDCVQNGSGQFGSCTFPTPAVGTWHVLIDRFSGSGTYQVTATSFGSFCGDPGNAGLSCDDGDACTSGETCQAGACTGGAPLTCDDGVVCTQDSCNPGIGCQFVPDHGSCGPCNACDLALGCTSGPRATCKGGTTLFAGKLKMKEGATPESDLLTWRWSRGVATTLADLGDPVTSDDYHLCLYDESGAPALALRADAPAGGICAGKPCWRASGSKGFTYNDRERSPNGLIKLTLSSGDEGRSRMSLKGKGSNLPPLPALPLALPLRAQIHAGNGQCWESTFSTVGAIRNDPGLFVGKSD